MNETIKKSTRRERISWYMYDWANSAFYTTVLTVFFGPYLTEIAKSAADIKGYIYPLGIPVYHGSYFPYLISLSVILQVVILPLLGAIADYSKIKKHLLIGFAYLGAFTAIFMYFIYGDNYILGGVLFIISNISLGASIVMYNAYLNDIAEVENRDKVSSIGWAIGYLGGGILLAINLLLLAKKDALGISTGMAVRISLSSAGMWWATFTLFPLFFLKRREAAKSMPPGKNMLTIGFSQIYNTFKNSVNYPKTLLFLIAYLVYNDGIQVVIAMSAQFGSQELHLDISVLTKTILMVQFVAFIGSLIFKQLAEKFDTKHVIMFSLVIWILGVLYSYFFLSTEYGFYIVAICFGIVLGGTQALSRSLFSVLIPKGREAEYFSLYEISDKGTSWLGPLIFGLALQMTYSYRLAVLSLIVFFVIGFILLFRVNIQKAMAESGNI